LTDSITFVFQQTIYMKKFTFPFAFILLGIPVIGTSSCNTFETSDSIKTKQDSIAFARAVLKLYPETQGTVTVGFGNRNENGKKISIPKFKGVSFAEIDTWAENYNKIPLFQNGEGQDVTGFMIDVHGMQCLTKNPKYEKIYIRFGKYSGTSSDKTDYTVMLVPLTASGDLVCPAGSLADDSEGGTSNYDALDPCPKECPTSWSKK
jgi:hypothetical protein